MPSRKTADRVPEQIRRLGRIHHVAVIVKEMEPALQFWRDALGLELDVVEDMADDRVRIAFLLQLLDLCARSLEVVPRLLEVGPRLLQALEVVLRPIEPGLEIG